MPKKDLKIVLIVLSFTILLFSIPIYYSIQNKLEAKKLKENYVVIKGFVVSSKASGNNFHDNVVRFEYIYDDSVYLSDLYHFNPKKPLPIGFPGLLKVSASNPSYAEFIVDTIVCNKEGACVKYIDKLVGGWSYEEVK